MVAISQQPLLRQVRQQNDRDCVVATLATVAKLPYHVAARNYLEYLGQNRLANPFEIHGLLECVTGTAWTGPVFNFYFFRRLRHVDSDSALRVVLIRQPLRRRYHLHNRMCHSILVDKGYIYDPELPGPVDLADYAYLNWRIAFEYEPVDPHRVRCIHRSRPDLMQPECPIIDMMYL